MASIRVWKERDMERFESHQDLFGGHLVSDQTLVSPGDPPDDSVWSSLPERMESIYFGHVRRCTLGLLRRRKTEGREELQLFDRWPALTFQDEKTLREAAGITRRWTIGPGFLARPGETAFGILLLGAEWDGSAGSGGEWRLRSHVEGYPSRFISRRSIGAGRWFRSMVTRVYAAYHQNVTRGYLYRLAAELRSRGPS